jgi:flagellar FliL protein
MWYACCFFRQPNAAREPQQRDSNNMAEDKKPDTSKESESAGTEPAKAAKGALLGAIAAAAILGVAVGGFVIGPRVARDSSEPTPPAESHTNSDAGHAAGEGEFFELENLVVNPAGSRGERFLMVSVAFEVPDGATVNQLHEREVQVRDVVSATLESQTLETLTKQGARQELKRQLSEAVAELAGNPAWMRVYIPRFVIQ